MNNRRFVEVITESAANYPEIAYSRKGSIYTCVNPYSYHIVRKNMEVYRKMSGLYVDGVLMCKFINLLWNKKIPRLSFDMSGMAVDLFARLNQSEESVYFIGSSQDSLENAIKNVHIAYPNIKIIDYRNGYFENSAERMSAIQKIVRVNPDFCIVGMGSPLQEQFVIDLKEAGFKGIAFTCGGFIHQTANDINYYPAWINRYNLRAFYRLYKEKGLFKRLYNVLIEFPILFTLDTISTRLFNPHNS